MLKLSIKESDIKNINTQLLLKSEGIAELKNPAVVDQIAKAAFVILGKRFMSAVDTHAGINHKKMHHIYEWGQVGNPKARLFVLERSSILNGNAVFSTKFLQSKTYVPVPAELLIPNKKGRYVSTKTIFKDKAQVMEDGKAVTFQARKTLAFLGNQGINFIQRGSVVNIPNPGGIGVKNSLQDFMSYWYSRNAQTIMDSSGLYEKIVQETSLCLSKNNAGVADVRKTVQQVVNSIANDIGVIK